MVSIIRAPCSKQSCDYSPVMFSPLLELLRPMRKKQLTKWVTTGRLLPSITSMLSSWHLGNKISRYNVLRLGANNKVLLVMTKCFCSWEGNIGRDIGGLLPVSAVCGGEVLRNKWNLVEKLLVLSPTRRPVISHHKQPQLVLWLHILETSIFL